MRKTLGVLALALVLAGCGNEAGPTPQGGGPQQADTPEALATKLRVYTTDQCFLTPDTQLPKGCQKYVTELASTVGMVRAQAGSKHPNLIPLADALDKHVGEYRDAHCDSVATPGNPCSQTLTEIANTLRDIKQIVDTQLATG
ncbi:hypothetical protein HFP15_33865 [Amycolatopsis sp. K13G38]|uniref:Lipoprotein n=1 Tax=Amycolatopsis acididurans TaxID=2724524 RepID=A0ABX1JGG6_9PSEU|nr:hypothetical protein [Amycolatopsis acididurans]NKQ57860.1 hypothetical protein [Amycolatopsis acididurans]